MGKGRNRGSDAANCTVLEKQLKIYLLLYQQPSKLESRIERLDSPRFKSSECIVGVRCEALQRVKSSNLLETLQTIFYLWQGQQNLTTYQFKYKIPINSNNAEVQKMVET